MATNQQYTRNEYIKLPVPEGTVSGAPVAVGAYRGVTTTAEHDGHAVVCLIGSWTFESVSGALNPGQIVYLNGSGNLTATTGDTPWGVANLDKPSGSGEAEVAPLGMFYAPAPTSGDSA